MRMPIHLDEQPADLEGTTLGEALEAAQQRLAEAGRIVVEVSVDGQTLDGETIERRADEAVEEKDIQLTSAAPGEVASEALSAVRTQLGEARVLQAEAADLLQRDQPGEALNKVSAAIEAWLATQQVVVQSASMLGIDLDQFEVEGQELTDSVNDLASQLKELRELIQLGDMIGLADTLAYEWPGITDRWDAVLGALLDRAAA
jgi:hypothetical protein